MQDGAAFYVTETRQDYIEPSGSVYVVSPIGSVDPSPTVKIRAGRPGDLGWAFMRQAEIYTAHGYDPVFETYVAKGLAPFLEGFDPGLDGLWIAELDGRRVGCIAIQHTAREAQLRWYFVDEASRGRGIGKRLLDTALGFCRDAGYTGVHLWTMSDLAAARRQYEKAGFRLITETDAPWLATERQQQWALDLP